MRRYLALLLAACLCVCPALAAGVDALGEDTPEDVTMTYVTNDQLPSDWALPYVADAYSLKLVDDNYGTYIQDPVTADTVAQMAETAAEKLALLAEESGEAQPIQAAGNTRGDVVNALCAALGTEEDGVEALQALGVLQGDGDSLALDRVCTYQEAMVMATRLILAAYDQEDAGSKGLFWKAEKGENTLYLLGTAHLDRGNLYPFHKTLRDAITASDTVILELDFNDQAGIMEFAAMQMYQDGTTLSHHISPELYGRTVAVCAAIGLDEGTVNSCKPWALANSLNSLLTSDTSAGDTPMAIDFYVNAAAVNRGIPVVGAESYALQGGIFESLTPEYQEAYLETNIAMVEALLGGGETAEPDGDTQAALAQQEELLDAIVTCWKSGDFEGFGQVYDKEAIVNSDDELNAKLFTQRDPGMVEVARAWLDREGANTAFMAVGAGHMMAPGGILPELEALGYTVTQIK